MDPERSDPPARAASPLPAWARSAPPVSMWLRAGWVLGHWRTVFLFAAAGAFVTGTTLLLSTRRYTAHTSFIPQESPTAAAGLSQLASQFGLPIAGRSGATSPQFYADLLLSREILRTVVETRYEVGGQTPFTGDLVAFFRIKARTRALELRDAMDRLKEVALVRLDRATGVVRLDVTTMSSDLSVAVAQRFLQVLDDFNRTQRQSRGRAERAFVEERMAAAQRELTEAEEALSGFYRRNRRVQDSPELVAEESRLLRLVALRQQLFLTLAQSYESAKIEEVRDTPVLTVLERPERFVEPRPRGTVRKTLVALLLGGGLGVGLALAREAARSARRDAASDFGRFLQVVRETASDARSALRIRRPR